MFRKKYYVLFSRIFFLNTMLMVIDFTGLFYKIFDPTVTYYFMIDLYEYHRVFYLVTVHVCFISFVYNKKEPNFFVPVVLSAAVFYLTTIFPVYITATRSLI